MCRGGGSVEEDGARGRRSRDGVALRSHDVALIIPETSACYTALTHIAGLTSAPTMAAQLPSVRMFFTRGLDSPSTVTMLAICKAEKKAGAQEAGQRGRRGR